MQFQLIDFDEASKEWNANKKKTLTGYKYICLSTIGKTNNRCKTVCFSQLDYCYIHRKKIQNIETKNVIKK